jgi:hypothetical protein
MGKIIGADFFSRHREAIVGKKLCLFSVAGAPERSPERTVWFEASVPADMRDAVRHFPLRGRAKDLNWWDRLLMSFPKMMLRIQYLRDPSEANRRALSSMDEFDAVSRDSIAPLVSAVRAL